MKKEEKKSYLIRYLIQNHERWIKGKDLYTYLQASSRQMRNYIQEFNSDYPQLILSSELGYRINLRYQSRFQEILNEKESVSARQKRIMEYLIANEKTSLFELESIFFVSDATIESDLIKIKKRFTYHNLRLLRRKEIIQAEGAEENKRSLLCDLYWESIQYQQPDSSSFFHRACRRLNEITEGLTQRDIECLAVYLTVSDMRIKKGKTLQTKSMAKVLYADKLMDEHTDINEKKAFDQMIEKLLFVPQKKDLKEIWEKMKDVFLFADSMEFVEELQIWLAQEIKCRTFLSFGHHQPKTLCFSYPLAHLMAIAFFHMISLEITETSLYSLTLLFASKIYLNHNEKIKVSILYLEDGMRDISIAASKKIYDIASKPIELKVKNWMQYDKEKDRYDLILTPVSMSFDIPYIRVHHLLNTKDMTRIQKSILHSFCTKKYQLALKWLKTIDIKESEQFPAKSYSVYKSKIKIYYLPSDKCAVELDSAHNGILFCVDAGSQELFFSLYDDLFNILVEVRYQKKLLPFKADSFADIITQILLDYYR